MEIILIRLSVKDKFRNIRIFCPEANFWALAQFPI